MAPYFQRINQVCSSWRGIGYTHLLTHRTNTVPLAHALRVNINKGRSHLNANLKSQEENYKSGLVFEHIHVQ